MKKYILEYCHPHACCYTAAKMAEGLKIPLYLMHERGFKQLLAARKDAGPCCCLQVIKPFYKRKSDVHIREEGDL